MSYADYSRPRLYAECSSPVARCGLCGGHLGRRRSRGPIERKDKMSNPRHHTSTLLSTHYHDLAHEVFRAACAVTNPQWTQCGSNPRAWRAPEDAAGGLVLWNHIGEFVRVEPAIEDAEKARAAADAAYEGLLYAGCLIGVVHASYASSGGRMVALCSAYGDYWITVGRCEETPRRGATEDCIVAADPRCTVYVLSRS